MMDGLLPLLAADSFLDANKLNIHYWEPPDDTMHGHEFFELTYVMEGEALQQLGTQGFPIGQGDYFLMDLQSYHCFHQTSDMKIINCLFAPECINPALSHCHSLSTMLSTQTHLNGSLRTDPSGHIYHDPDGRIRQLMERMLQEYQTKGPGYLEMIRCCLIEVLIYTIRIPIVNSNTEQYHPAVAAMAQYFDEHYADALSLSDLSSRLCYTPQYLCSLFHQVAGVSPGVYLQKVRVEHSCRLLAKSRLSITRVAQEVGYTDVKYFSQIFKRHIGLSPRAFRTGKTEVL